MASSTRKRKSVKIEPSEDEPITPKFEASEYKPTNMKPSDIKLLTPKIEIDYVISKLAAVAMTLTKSILQKSNTSNVVFSPLSVQLVLGLVAAGSEGDTKKQLLSFLKAENTAELNSFASHVYERVFTCISNTMSLANGVWIDKSLSFKPHFTRVVDDVYKAVFDVVDFQNNASEATDKVNSWTQNATNGLVIDTVAPDLFDNQTKIVFANAIYFSGSWRFPFTLCLTKTFDFHLLNGGSTVQVPFMSNNMRDAFVSAFNEFKVLRLPYEGWRDISMYIFLPDAKDGLPSLLDKLGSEIGFLERHIPNQSQVLGEFWIPKFKVSFGFEATEALKELGVRAPFIPGGLDEMVDSEKTELLYISNIIQKTCIEINEAGTEAASADRILMVRGGRGPVRIDFVADHPFLFLIREDRSGVVLFTGQVLNPLATR